MTCQPLIIVAAYLFLSICTSVTGNTQALTQPNFEEATFRFSIRPKRTDSYCIAADKDKPNKLTLEPCSRDSLFLWGLHPDKNNFTAIIPRAIFNDKTEKCLAPGAPSLAFTCEEGNKRQLWTWEHKFTNADDRSSFYNVVNVATSECLAFVGFKTPPKTVKCDTSDDSLWKLTGG